MINISEIVVWAILTSSLFFHLMFSFNVFVKNKKPSDLLKYSNRHAERSLAKVFECSKGEAIENKIKIKHIDKEINKMEKTKVLGYKERNSDVIVEVEFKDYGIMTIDLSKIDNIYLSVKDNYVDFGNSRANFNDFESAKTFYEELKWLYTTPVGKLRP